MLSESIFVASSFVFFFIDLKRKIKKAHMAITKAIMPRTVPLLIVVGEDRCTEELDADIDNA